MRATKLIGVGLALLGLALCYTGWRSRNRLEEPENWDEDQVSSGSVADYGFIFGVILIFVGLLLLAFS